jgi:hypothetical protein
MTSGLPLEQDNNRLQGLQPVVEYLRNGLYKYAVGNCSQSAEANKLKLQLQSEVSQMPLSLNLRGQHLNPKA